MSDGQGQRPTHLPLHALLCIEARCPPLAVQGTKIGTFNGVINVAGALYMSVLFMGILDCMMVMNLIAIRRCGSSWMLLPCKQLVSKGSCSPVAVGVLAIYPPACVGTLLTAGMCPQLLGWVAQLTYSLCIHFIPSCMYFVQGCVLPGARCRHLLSGPLHCR